MGVCVCAGGGEGSHCVCGVHYSLNECFVHFLLGHYLSEKGKNKKKADAGRCGGKTSRTQMMPECSADTVYFQHEPGKYIHLYFPHNSTAAVSRSRYITGKQTEEDDSFYFKN